MEIRDVVKVEEKELVPNAYQRWLRNQCKKKGHNYMLCVGAGNTVYNECTECRSRVVIKEKHLEPVC